VSVTVHDVPRHYGETVSATLRWSISGELTPGCIVEWVGTLGK
jgi:hypothetical protein